MRLRTGVRALAARVAPDPASEYDDSANLVMVGLFRTLLLLTILWPFAVSVAQLADLTPRPELSPEQVVRYQVTALQHNDDPRTDAGIERTFRFASPSNRASTGPLEKFAQIVRSPAYSPMLNNLSSSIVRSEVKDDRARVAVEVVTDTGLRVTYVFVLSRQSEGEFNNCWMTDGVVPAEQGRDATDQGVTI